MSLEEILARTAAALGGLPGGFVVVGGTAHRLLARRAEAAPVQFEPLATLDIDLVVPTDRPLAGDELRAALCSSGFQEELTGVGTHATARYRWGDTPSYPQFLARRTGSSTRHGSEPMLLGGLLAERVPHLGVLLAAPIQTEVQSPSGGLALSVVNPASFILQKTLIAPDRARQGGNSAAKDLLYIYDTAQMYPPRHEAMTRHAKPAWESLSHAEHRQVGNWIRHLTAGPDSACQQAAYMAQQAGRKSPPRPDDLAAVCLEIVDTIRTAARGE